MAKAAFNKKNLLTSKLDSNLRNKPVKCHIWNVAQCGAGGGWRRSLGLIMREMKGYYTELRRGISYIE
jgi:hypothetical protein